MARPFKSRIYKPKVIWAPDLMGWAVQTPFDTEISTGQEFRADLKARVNRPVRWDNDIKCWIVDEGDEQIVRKLLAYYWPSYEAEWGEKPKGSNGFGSHYDPTADDSAFRKLFQLAGRDNCNKLWRSALQMHHPDTGGDNQKAQEVNKAWTEIKKQLNW